MPQRPLLAGLRRSRILMRVRRMLGNDPLVLALVAAVAGAAVGWAAIGLREAIALAQAAFFGTGGDRLYRAAQALPWWQVLLAPALGGLLAGILAGWLPRGPGPGGVASVIEASACTDRPLSLPAGLGTAALAALAIGSGASVGREGPAIHLGATLGGWLGRVLHLGRELARTLLACGAAAAVAASFNAPIAGALFVQEVVARHTPQAAFLPVVIASVTATAVSRRWFGNFPAFSVPSLHGGSLGEFPAFAGLGLLGAVLAVAFVRLVSAARARLDETGWPPPLRLMAAGLGVGAIAVPFPQVLGVGYDIADESLRGAVPVVLLAALVAAKLVASALALGGGLPGGVFGPALALGALLGGLYGHAAAWLLPGWISPSGAYALVGMGAVASAVLGAPISTTLMVFELTGDYEITIQTLVAAVMSSVFFQRMLGCRSYFDQQVAPECKPAD